MIASGSSERGLSEVTIARSASSRRDLPHQRPLAAVAIAAGAEHDDHAPARRARAPHGAPWRASRACARSRRGRRTAAPRRSPRSGPGRPSTLATPSAIASSSRSSSSPAATAPRTFSTLKQTAQRRLDVDPAGAEPAAASRRARARSGRISASVREPERDERRAVQAAQLVREPPAPLGADVHRGGRWLRPREQPPLRLEVLLHRPVQVEVVLAQVREDEHVEANAVETPQRRAVRARLDRGAAVARVEHLAEEPLQVDRLRRRERRGPRARLRRSTRPSRRDPAGARPPSRIERSRNAVVVFPFVPVTPASSSSFVGSPKNASAATAIDSRTTATSELRDGDVERALDDERGRAALDRLPRRGRGRRRAAAARRRRARPRVTRRVSYARSPISTGLPPVTSLGASARISASSCTAAKASDVASGQCSRAAAQRADLRADAAVCGSVRRNLEVLEVEARDLAEGRRGDDAAVDVAVRLVDHDHDHELRLRRGHHADERGDVLRRRVACRRGRSSRRSPSCRRRCSRGSQPRCRCPRGRRRAASTSSAPRRARDDPATARRRARVVPVDAVDEMRLHEHAAVRDRRVRARHLHRRHCDAVADRDGADRRARPLVERQGEARRLAGEVDAGLRAEAEARRPSDASRPAPSRSAIVIVPMFDDCSTICCTVRRSVAADVRLVDHAVGDLDRRREAERRARRDDVVLRAPPAIVTSLKVEPGSYVSVTARLRRRSARVVGNRFALKRRRTSPSPAPRPCAGPCTTAVAARAPQRRTVSWSTSSAFAWISRSIVSRTLLPGVSGFVSTTSSARPNGSFTIVWLPGLPGERPVERALEPLEALVVEARVAEHLRGDRPLRVEAQLLRVEAEAGEVERLQDLRLARVRLARDVDEAPRAVDERRVQRRRVEPELLRRRRA